jgi:hypothetical protein
MIAFRTQIDKSGLEKFQKEVHDQLANTKSGKVHDCMIKWEARYIGAMRKRFVDNSRGGGDWPKLASSTIFKRMRERNDGNPAILRDTGILLNVLTPLVAVPGKFFEFLSMGIRTGFGGSAIHALQKALKTKKSKRKAGRTITNMTIADIAKFHQEGGGNLPQREILIEPDNVLVDLMAGDLQTALQGTIKDCEIYKR